MFCPTNLECRALGLLFWPNRKLIQGRTSCQCKTYWFLQPPGPYLTMFVFHSKQIQLDHRLLGLGWAEENVKDTTHKTLEPFNAIGLKSLEIFLIYKYFFLSLFLEKKNSSINWITIFCQQVVSLMNIHTECSQVN